LVARLAENFEGDFTVHYNLAPPLIAPRDRATGRPQKRRFGPFMGQAFSVLARARPLRGTPLDIFGYGAHRRLERQLIRDYEALVDQTLAQARASNLDAAEAVLRAHDRVRGFDVVKEKSVAEVRQALPGLVARLTGG
jgi:indolepyruvate ferredoxin oxidoreductase